MLYCYTDSNKFISVGIYLLGRISLCFELVCLQYFFLYKMMSRTSAGIIAILNIDMTQCLMYMYIDIIFLLFQPTLKNCKLYFFFKLGSEYIVSRIYFLNFVYTSYFNITFITVSRKIFNKKKPVILPPPLNQLPRSCTHHLLSSY